MKLILILMAISITFIFSMAVTWWIGGMEFKPMAWSQEDRGFWLFMTIIISVYPSMAVVIFYKGKQS